MTYEVYSDGFFMMPEAARYYSPVKVPVTEQTRLHHSHQQLKAGERF